MSRLLDTINGLAPHEGLATGANLCYTSYRLTQRASGSTGPRPESRDIGGFSVEERINPQDYLEVILKRWRLILGTTFLVMVTAAIVSSITPPTYQASATLLIPEAIASPMHVSLIESTDVERRVTDALKTTLPPSQQAPGSLLQKVKASQSDDLKLIQITVQCDSPQKAAKVANAWATASSEYISEVCGEALEMELLEGQLEIAEENLRGVENALKQFEEESGFVILETRITTKIKESKGIVEGLTELGPLGWELEAKLSTFGDYQTARGNVKLAILEARALKELIEQKGTAIPNPLISGLMTRLLSAGPVRREVGLRFQAFPAEIDDHDLTPAQQLERLDDIIMLLETQDSALEGAIEQLLVEIAQLERNLARMKLELGSHIRAKALAEEICMDLARQLEETRIVARVGVNEPRIVISAIEPTSPVPSKRGTKIALAGMGGLFLGIFGAFIMQHLEALRTGKSG